jgi:hypothetical protein
LNESRRPTMWNCSGRTDLSSTITSGIYSKTELDWT